MYKTIRHGENSLQYTILPQNDDFRIEGKLSAASSSSSSSSAASSKRSSAAGQRRRRSFFAYLGLIFVCTVIIGAVLIPFLVSAECLPNPTEWFLKTKAALTHSRAPTGSGVGIVAGARTGSGDAIPGTLPTGSPLLQLGQSVGKTVQIVNRNGIEQFVLKVNKTSATAPTTGSEELQQVLPLSSSTTTTASNSTTTTTTKAPTTSSSTSTTAATTTTTREQPPPPPVPVSTTGYVAVVPPQAQQRHLPATTITTRIIQVPLLKSAAKKPIMPPVLAKTQGAVEQQQQQGAKMEKGQNKSNSDWIKTHWAYIDPSTYFQWTGYKAEDSVLLPALLGFALIGMILIITVCLVARNKRTIVSSVRKRNRNDIEEQGAEDNATLLTTTNLSDDD
ncbi:mucin-5AC [Drosophila madeirensis]|uniref:Mucin-5AC n=1 Tax=Drosophila madeirensis TaxID=30013 RepID=A0AAU9FXI6_DROMD